MVVSYYGSICEATASSFMLVIYIYILISTCVNIYIYSIKSYVLDIQCKAQICFKPNTFWTSSFESQTLSLNPRLLERTPPRPWRRRPRVLLTRPRWGSVEGCRLEFLTFRNWPLLPHPNSVFLESRMTNSNERKKGTAEKLEVWADFWVEIPCSQFLVYLGWVLDGLSMVCSFMVGVSGNVRNGDFSMIVETMNQVGIRFGTSCDCSFGNLLYSNFQVPIFEFVWHVLKQHVGRSARKKVLQNNPFLRNLPFKTMRHLQTNPQGSTNYNYFWSK